MKAQQWNPAQGRFVEVEQVAPRFVTSVDPDPLCMPSRVEPNTGRTVDDHRRVEQVRMTQADKERREAARKAAQERQRQRERIEQAEQERQKRAAERKRLRDYFRQLTQAEKDALIEQVRGIPVEDWPMPNGAGDHGALPVSLKSSGG
jgi:hypothetical protein